MLEIRLLIALLAAAGIVYMATPLAVHVAGRLDFFDKPAGYKGHARPTPYLGGAAVMVGFLLALMAVTSDWSRTLPLAVGASLLWAVGTLDDRRTVSPAWRVAVELAAATGVWALGLGWDVGLGAGVDLLFTCAWIVGVVNAFNLFDNMDGATGTMALVVAVAVAALGVVDADPWVAVSAAALAGACLGFLPHNLSSPAKIFLGDGGSMPVGFAVATLVMTGSSAALPAWQSLIVGLLLVGVPALDTALVVISRRRRGISILTGGRDHLTHRTRGRLRTTRAVAMALGGFQALVSVIALFAINGGSAAIVAVVSLYLLAAGGAIVLLETRDESAVGARAASGAAGGRRLTDRSIGRRVLVVVLGLGAGVSAFFTGFYDDSVWVPIGLGLATLVTAGVIAHPVRLSLPGKAVIGGLFGLGLLSLVSSNWADSIERATAEGNRFLLLGVAVAAAIVLVRDDRMAAWLTGALGVGILLVAGDVVIRMLGGHPGSLFVGGRLNAPLGYINGEACLFVMAIWLAVGLAERREPWLAGLGAAGATLSACLAILSQSRGAALAMGAALVVVIALVPGQMRRCFALVIVALAVAVASGPLLGIYDGGANRPLDVSVAHRAGMAILLATLGAGVVWAVLVAAVQRASATGPLVARRFGHAGAVLLLVVALAAAGSALTSTGRIEHAARAQWHAFIRVSEPGSTTAPTTATTQTRLLSGAGNRYEYWRVACHAWTTHRLVGLGAGNYDTAYFAERKISEDIRQPHSLEMQVLSELGLAGAVLLGLFFVGLVLGGWRASRSAVAPGLRRSLVVASIGAGTAWLVHTSVDWIHLLPGVSAVALLLVAVLVPARSPDTVPDREPARGDTRRRRLRALAAAGAVATALVVTTISLSRQGLAQYFRVRAQDALVTRPAGAIREADRSLRLDSESPDSYYVKAAALARFDRGEDATATLLEAAAKEPRNFVTWTLLGDVAVRRGLRAQARDFYGRAFKLNPMDPILRKLARESPPGA